jgi:signal transduction histidine kinase
MASAALLTALLTLPSGTSPWPTVQPFLPAYITGVLVFDLTTAFLLLTEFFAVRRPSLTILAGAYLYSSLVTIPHLLSFSGVFSESGLLGATSQTAPWLWMFWHGGFPLFVLAYLLTDIRYMHTELTRPQARRLAISVIAAVIAIVGLISVLTYRFTWLLPIIIEENAFSLLAKSGIGQAVWILNVMACLGLLWLKRCRSVLNLWLSVAMFAFLLDVTLMSFSGARYSIGWYVARMTSVFSAGIVLGMLLLELRKLYSLALSSNEQGQQQGVELVRLNEQLFAEKKRIQQVIESVKEGMLLCDSSGQILYSNAPMNALLAFGRAFIEERVQHYLTQQRNEYHERLRLFVDGDSRYFELYVLPIGDPNALDNHGLQLFVFRDRTNEEIVEQMKDEIVSTVSHELRTPLSSIMGFAEMMVNRELTEDRQKKYSETIYRESLRLSSIINDFLDLQRLQSGKLAFHFTLNDLKPFLHEVIQHWHLNNGFEVTITEPQIAVMARTDNDRLRQVLDNLISNAIKYSPGGERVDVRLGLTDSHVLIEVQDYGLGIPGIAQSKLFSRFFRVDNSDRRNIGGTGLGLAIAKEIVEAHSGNLYFESEHGAGSTFFVRLPRVQAS